MPTAFCIDCTLPFSHCICKLWPAVTLKQFSILFHPLERQKRSSTGRLIQRLSHMHNATWHRCDHEVLAHQFQHHVLLYPETADVTSPTLVKLSELKAPLLILDGTWQQTRKMMRQSPWLQALPRASFRLDKDSSPSQFRLRRNQQAQGLSTLEAIAKALFEQGHSQQQQDLLNFFAEFQSSFCAAQTVGALK